MRMIETLDAGKVIDELLATATQRRIEGDTDEKTTLDSLEAVETFLQQFIVEARARGYRVWHDAVACPIDEFDIDVKCVTPGELRDTMTARQIRLADECELQLGLLCGDYREFLEFIIDADECGNDGVEDVAHAWREEHPGS